MKETNGKEIGTKVWFMGNELTITTEPFELYGRMFQDAVDKKNATVVTIKVPSMKELENYNSLQAANLVGVLQSCRKINSLEWMEKAALLLTEITGERHWVEGVAQFDGVYNYFIRSESIDSVAESC